MSDRAELAALVDQVRELWCDWDPIGNSPRDEYDSYLQPTLALQHLLACGRLAAPARGVRIKRGLSLISGSTIRVLPRR